MLLPCGEATGLAWMWAKSQGVADRFSHHAKLRSMRSCPIVRTESQPKSVACIARDDVHMDVEYLLTCRFAVCQEEVDAFTGEATCPQCLADLLGHLEQVRTALGIQISQVGSVSVGDNQHMTRVDWLDVHEGSAQPVFPSDA